MIEKMSEDELRKPLPICFKTYFVCNHYAVGVLNRGELIKLRAFCPLCEAERDIRFLAELRRLDGFKEAPPFYRALIDQERVIMIST